MSESRERALVTFTVAVLVVYVPIETWYSAPELWDPFYLVDLAGMVLLALGATGFRSQGRLRVGLLAAGYAWTAANFWRALFGRVADLRQGGQLDYGLAELCFIGCILLAAFAGLVWSLTLLRREPEPWNPRTLEP
jgi:hypothetical protein